MSTKICKPLHLLILALPLWVCSCSNPEETAQATPKTDTVLIEQMKFVPENISIQKGDTVLFINKDLVAHNATEIDSTWKSPDLQMNESWKFVPEKSSDYFCSIHLVMKGKITVK